MDVPSVPISKCYEFGGASKLTRENPFGSSSGKEMFRVSLCPFDGNEFRIAASIKEPLDSWNYVEVVAYGDNTRYWLNKSSLIKRLSANSSARGFLSAHFPKLSEKVNKRLGLQLQNTEITEESESSPKETIWSRIAKLFAKMFERKARGSPAPSISGSGAPAPSGSDSGSSTTGYELGYAHSMSSVRRKAAIARRNAAIARRNAPAAL